MLSFLSLTFMDNLTAIAIIFLCLFCLYLYYDNKKLNNIIDELKTRDKDNYEKNILKEDIISIKDISNDVREDKINNAISRDKLADKNDISLDNKEKKLDKNVDNLLKKDNIDKKVYVKEDITNSPKATSDVNNDNSEIKFNIDDFVKKDNIYRKLDSSKMDRDYLTEVSRELANNMAPQTIELTDYEQEQEDNAIISYKELLDSSKKEEAINDGTVEFIEELKKFRNNLRR